MDCIFCRIVAGDVTASVVWETPETVAFLDTRPVFKGHVLVVPRRHVETLLDLPDDLLTALFTTVRSVAAGVVAGLGRRGRSWR